MSKNIVSLIGGIILIFSVFLPIISISTTYHDYDVIFHYWLSGLMYASFSDGDDNKSGYTFSPNIIGFGCMASLIAFGTLIIVKALQQKDPKLLIIFGFVSIGIIICFTFWMMTLFTFVMKNEGLGSLSSSLVPSYGFYSVLIGGVLIIIGGFLGIGKTDYDSKSRTQIPTQTAPVPTHQNPAPKEYTICPKCGIRNNTKFCTNCGEKLT